MAHTRKLINRPWQSLRYTPTAAIASPYRFVTNDTDSDSCVLSASHDAANGVILQKAAAGEPVEVVIEGIALVELGETINPGQLVMAGTAGVAMVATTGQPSLGKCIVGGAVGELGSVHLCLASGNLAA